MPFLAIPGKHLNLKELKMVSAVGIEPTTY